MGTARQPQPVKLVVSILGGDPALLEEAEACLEEAFGPVDYRSGLLPFHHTTYYEPEMGADLKRRIVAFQRLVDPGDLAAIKRRTNALEERWAVEGKRRVNLDPGYVDLGKLVLASTKNHAHRIYLGQGIYAEVTLHYRGGRFQPWPWTYPDYASEEYCRLFGEIRALYQAQSRALRAASGRV